MELYLLRHADAGDPDAWDGPDDTRPLSAKGRRQAERLGRHLASIHFRPDAIVSSPKLRAVETAELVAGALGCPFTTDEQVLGPLDPDSLVDLAADAGDPKAMLLVGHDPDFSELLATLTGANAPLKKGALARIDVDADHPDSGRLRWLLSPDAIAG